MREAHSRFDLYQWLSNDTIAAFERLATVRRCGNGEVVYSQQDEGEQMFRLLSGSMRMSVAKADGRELLYALFGPGDCFGESSCVDGDVRPQTAEAGSDVRIQVISRSAFTNLATEFPDFQHALLCLLARHMRLISGYFAEAFFEDATARVASRIAAVVKSFGVEEPGGLRLSLRLAQTDLAMMTGSSRQSVNKILQQLQAAGILKIRYGNLQIIDMPSLMAAAQPR